MKTREVGSLICTHLDECDQDQRAALMELSLQNSEWDENKTHIVAHPIRYGKPDLV